VTLPLYPGMTDEMVTSGGGCYAASDGTRGRMMPDGPRLFQKKERNNLPFYRFSGNFCRVSAEFREERIAGTTGCFRTDPMRLLKCEAHEHHIYNSTNVLFCQDYAAINYL
jgi:hypothetical protein